VSGGVFISYRREDASGFARAIRDRVAERLDRKNVFFDVDNIEPGVDFVDFVTENVGACDALVAVIGKRWISSSDDNNRRRLDNPADLMRIEIEAALKRGVRVIPVLVDGADMPRTEDLPDGLKMLARRNAIPISNDRFDSDVERLNNALYEIMEKRRQREAAEAERAAHEEHEKREAAETARKAEEAQRLAHAEAQRAIEEQRAREAAEAERAAKEELEKREAAEAAEKAEQARRLADAEAARRAEDDRRAQEAAGAERAARAAREECEKREAAHTPERERLRREAEALAAAKAAGAAPSVEEEPPAQKPDVKPANAKTGGDAASAVPFLSSSAAPVQAAPARPSRAKNWRIAGRVRSGIVSRRGIRLAAREPPGCRTHPLQRAGKQRRDDRSSLFADTQVRDGDTADRRTHARENGRQ